MKKFYFLTSIISIMCFGSFAATWYSLSGATDATSLSSWNSLANGLGGTPGNFTHPGDVFIIQTNGMTCTAVWNVTGSLQIGSGGAGTLSVTTTPTITGKITVNNGGTLTINTAGTVPSLANVQGATSTIVFAGSGNYSFPTITYGNFTNSSSGTSSFAGAVTISGNFLQSAGTVSMGGATAVTGNITISSGTLRALTFGLTCHGNFSNSGTFNAGTGSVTFNGSGLQTIGGSTNAAFYNLIINNTSAGAPAINGVTLGLNTSVTNVLTFTTGLINTGAFTLSLPGAGASVTGAGAAKYVYGTESKTITGLTTVTYETGDNNYTPATLTLNTAGTGGTIAVISNAGTYSTIPNYNISNMSNTNYVTHYWTISSAGATGFTTVNPKFTYNLADITGGSNAGFIGQLYNGGNWSLFTCTNTSAPYATNPTTDLTTYTGTYILGLKSPLTVSPASLSFINAPNTTSAAQTFTISGSSISGNVTVTPSANFMVLNPNTGLYTASSFVIAAGGSTITPSSLSVEYIAPNTPGVYSGTITVSSPYAVNQTVLLTGQNSNSGTFTYGTGGNFATLAAALTYFNTNGINNSVVLNSYVNGWSETAPAGGFKLGSAVLNASLNSSTTLTINGYPGGTNTTLTAPVGTGAFDFIFGISGCDYVIIDGLNLQESGANATANTRMEMGFGFFNLNAVAPFDGCQNDEIENCTITLNAANTNLCYGIASYHKTAANVAITPTATVDLHNNNLIYKNTISNCFTPVLFSGYAAPIPYTFYDQGNDVGGSATATGNTFSNFGSMGAVSNTAYGVALINQNNGNASYNNMNNTSGGGSANINTLYGVYCSGINSTFTANNNTMTFTEVNGGSAVAFDGIYLQNAGSALTANNNKITLTEASGTAVIINGISNTGSNLTANHNNINVTYSISGAASACQGIVTTPTGVLRVQYDTVTITNSGTAQSATTNFINNLGNATTVTMSNNNLTGTLNTTGVVVGMYNQGTATQLKMDNNTMTITNIQTAPASNYGIYNLHAYTNTEMLSNSITLNLASATSGTAYGIDLQGGGSNSFDCNNNTITETGFNAFGIYNIASNVSVTNNFNSNNITTTVTSGTTYGIYNANTAAASTTSEVSNTINNTSTTGANYGLYNFVTAATDTVMYMNYNNIKCVSTTGVIAGSFNESRYSNIITQSWNTIDISNTAASSNGMYFIHNAPGSGGTNYSATNTTASVSINNNTFKSTSGLNTTNTSQFGQSYSGGVTLIDDNFPNALDSVCYNHTSGTIANTAASGQFIGLYLMQMNNAITNYDVFVGNNFSNIILSGSNIFVGIGRGTYQQQPLLVAFDTISNITSTTGYIAGIINDFVNSTSVTQNCQINNFNTAGDVYGIAYSYFQPSYPEPTLGTKSLAVYGGTIINNNINNLKTTGASTSACGINYYPVAGNTNFSISNDTVYNIIATGTTAPATYGIYNSPTGSNNIINLNNNYIHDISGQGATGNTVSTGIFFANNAAGVNTYNIYNNDLYNINAGSNGATTQAIGMKLTATSGTFNIYNNFISALTASVSATPQSIIGLYLTATGANWNTYFNTIQIGTNSTAVSSTGANFGAAGVLYPSGASLLTLENNIINLNVTPNGTGVGAAVQRNVAAVANTPPAITNFMSNYNIYNINSNAKNYMYVECTSGGAAKNGFALSGLTNSAPNNIFNDANFNVCASLYKAFIGSGREQRTYSENNLGAGATTGTFVPSGSSWAYQNGISISAPSISTDWNNITRPTNPSIGALEFTGSLPSNGAPVVDLTAINVISYCPSNAPSATAVITSGAGINTTAGTKPRLYFKKTTEANAFSATNTSAFNGWKYVEATNSTSPFTFTPNYALLTSAVTAGNVIQYFVVAQDLNVTPNVGYATVGFSNCPSTVNITAGNTTTALPAINTYSVLAVPAFSTQVTPQFFCSTGNPAYLGLSTATGDLNIQWKSSTDGVTFSNIASATTVNFTATPPAIAGGSSSGSIYFKAMLSCGASTVAASTINTATEYQPIVTTNAAPAICGTATASLTATNNAGTIYWYTTANGGTPIASGSPYTPTLSATTIFYAADSFGTFGNPQTLGMRVPVAPVNWNMDNLVFPGGILSGFHQEGFDFTVTNPMTLNSVDVYPYATGNYAITLYTSAGVALYTQTFALTGNSSTPVATTCTFNTPSNWYLPSGSYELAFSTIPGGGAVWADNTGIAYPYNDTTNNISMTGVTYYTGYYFFYNWKLYSGCISPRTAVTVTDNAVPTAGTANATPSSICSGNSANLHESSSPAGTGTLQSYTWSGPSGFTATGAGPSVGAATVTPAASGYYSLTVTYAGNGCNSNAATTYITVGANATPTITPSPLVICTGATYSVTANPSGGAWSLGSGSSYASISASGVVTGIAAGTAVISYTSLCGAVTTATVTVNQLPAAISGVAEICINPATTTFTDATAGGAWSNAPATYGTINSSTGVFSAAYAVGTTTITYTAGNGCTVTQSLVVDNASPAPITGTFTVCSGNTQSLGDITTGGIWSSSNTSAATISGAGIITAVSNGNTTISYNTGCGTAVTQAVNIYGTSVTISNSGPYCSGNSISLSATLGTPAGSTYSWTGPNGYTSTTLSPTLPGIINASGIYSLGATQGGCTSSASTFVVVDTTVNLSVSASPSNVCNSGSSTISDVVSGPTAFQLYPIAYSPATFTVTATLTNASAWTGGYDDGYINVAMPFNFNFYGNSYASVYIDVNGYVTFGSAVSTSNATAKALPSTIAPSSAGAKPMIALFWDDMSLTSGSITYGVAGVIPFRQFVISYNSVPDDVDFNSGQIILYESTNAIDMMVAHTTVSPMTCGVQNATGTQAVAVHGHNNNTYQVNGAGEGWRFATPSYNYQWTPATFLTNTNEPFTTAAGVTSSITYSVSTSDAFSQCPTVNVSTVSVTVAGGEPTASSLTANLNPICAGGTTTLTAGAITGGTPSVAPTYIWTYTDPASVVHALGNTSVNTLSATPSNGAGVYTYSVTIFEPVAGCSSGPATILTFTVNAIPTATVTGTNTICNGSVSTLSVTGTANAAITLSPAGTLTLNGAGAGSYNVSPNTNTTYTISNVSLLGCSQAGTGSAVITVNAIPTATVTGTATICNGNSTALSVNGSANSSVTFSDGGNITLNGLGAGSYNVSPNTNTTYTISNVNLLGCSQAGTGSAVITVNAIPTATVTGSATICNGNSTALTINGSANASVTFSDGGNITLNGSGAGSYNVSPSSNTTYNISNVSLLGCSQVGTGSTVITVNALPNATIIGTTTICNGNSTALTVNGSANANITFSDGGNVTLNGSGNSSYIVSPTTNTTYTISNVSLLGCSQAGTGSAVITVNALPAITSVTMPTVCVNAATTGIIYSATGNPATYSLVWDATAHNAGFSDVSAGTSLPVSPLTVSVGNTAAAGVTYHGTVTISTTIGCSGSQNINVAVVALPTSGGVTPSLNNICNSGSSVLTVGTPNGGSGTVSSYTWSYTDPTTAVTSLGTIASNTLTVTPGGAGTGVYTYSVTVNMTGSGCFVSDNTSVTVAPQPTATITPSSVNICTGTTLHLNGTISGGAGNAAILWNGPVATDGSNFSASGTLSAGINTLTAAYTPTATSTGVYTLAFTYGANTGCNITPVTTNSVVFSTPSSITIGSPAAVCQGITADNLTYSSTTGNPNTYSITWDGSATTAGFNNVSGASLPASPIVLSVPAGAGANTYTGILTVDDGATCTSEPINIFSVTVLPQAVATIASAPNVCIGYNGYATFTGTPSAVISYSVSLGSVLTATLSVGGTYSFGVGAVSSPINVTLINSTNGLCSTTENATATISPLNQQWLGTTNSDWNTASNWGCNFVPVSNNDVIIPAGTPNPVVLGTSASGIARNLNIMPSAVVTLNGGSVLTVNANMQNNGIVTGAGSLNMGGSAAQTISGQCNVGNIQINNTTGVSIATVLDTMWLNGSLYLTSGNFYTSNSLVVVVDSNGGSGNIGAITGGSISGNVIMKQWIHSGRRAYRFWGTPFSNNIALNQLEHYIDITGTGGAVNGFTPTITNASSAWWYDNRVANAALSLDPGWITFNTANSNTASPNDTNNVRKFEGIRFLDRGYKGQGLDGNPYTPGTSMICQYGTINTGNANVPMYNYGTGKAYNQISNPYPSPVDIGTVIYNAAQAGRILGPLFYIWDPYLGTAGAYANIAYTSGGGGAAPFYIQPNTSFQVRTVTTASVSPVYLNFTEANKGTIVSPVPGTSVAGDLRSIELPKFTMLTVYDSNYHPFDMWYMGFNDEATDGEDDQFDGGKPVNPDLNFYSWSADNTKLSADARPYKAGNVIPLGFYSDVAQKFIIRVDGYIATTGTDAYLHDKLMNTFTKLEQGAEYKFTITNDARTQGDERFEISMGAADVAETSAKPMQVVVTPNPATDEVSIAFSAAKSANTSLRVTDISGVCVYSEELGQMQHGKVSISLDRFASGMYMVELVSGDNKVVQRLVKE